MKMSFILLLLLFATHSFANTEWMVRFDIFQAYTQATISTENIDYDDKDTDDATNRSTVFALYAGKRISSNHQIIAYIDRSYTDFDDGDEFTSTEIGMGIEWNQSEEFHKSTYASFLISSEYSVDEEDDGDKDTDTDVFFKFRLGRRIPLLGKKGYVTYSPNIDLAIKSLDSDERDTIDRYTIASINFLMFDILF